MFHFFFVYAFTKKKSAENTIPKSVFLFLIISAMIMLSTACRADIVFIIIPLAINYHYLIRRIKIFRALIFSILFIFVVIGLNYHRLYNYGPRHETIAYLDYISGGNEISMFFYHLFAQMSLVATCFKDVISIVPSYHDYFYGMLIPQTLSTFLPGHQDPPGAILKAAGNLNFQGGQMNTTLVGDFYIDFGIIGIVIGMFLLGIAVKLAYNNLLKTKTATACIIYSYVYYSLIVGIPGGLFSQTIRYYYFIIIIGFCFYVKKKCVLFEVKSAASSV